MTSKSIALFVAGLLWALWMLVGVSIAGISVMAFDAPGSSQQLMPWMFFGAAAFWPVWSLACLAYAIVLVMRGTQSAATRALVWSLAGALPLAVVIGGGLLVGL